MHHVLQAARNADYEFVDLYSTTNPREGSEGTATPLHEWPAFQKLQDRVLNGTRPRLAVQMHDNVPGVGDSLWELYLHPWQHYLQAPHPAHRACALRAPPPTLCCRHRVCMSTPPFPPGLQVEGGGVHTGCRRTAQPPLLRTALHILWHC